MLGAGREGKRVSGLSVFFEPKGVALIGARSSPGFGYGIPLVLKRHGWAARTFLVNPRGGELHGMKVYGSLDDVEGPVDLAVVVVPARSVPGVMRDIGRRGIRHAIVESAGFAETGTGGAALQEEAMAEAREHGIRVIGPNCVGVVNTANGFSTVEVIDEAMNPGSTAIIAQSGVFGAVMLDMLHEYRLHVSKAVTLGNRVDVGEPEVLEYLRRDPQTAVVMMYLEGAADGRGLLETLKRTTREKPVLVLKSGRSPEGRHATASHTASISGEDEVYDAVFRQAGAVRAGSLEELVEMARVFSALPLPRGGRLAIVTSSGSLGVMAADAAVSRGLEVPALGAETARRVTRGAPSWMNVRNPVDVGPSAQFPSALAAVLEDPDVDMVLAITVMPYAIFRIVTGRGSTGVNWFGDIRGIHAKRPAKPLAVCAVGHHDFIERMREISGPAVPVFASPEPAVRALAALRSYAR